jgi:methyl-accepting chemotaxis protein
VLDNMEYITGRVRGITDSIDDQLTSVRESLASVRSIAENVMSFERRVQERVEGPILEGVAVIAGVFKGLRAMVERFRS